MKKSFRYSLLITLTLLIFIGLVNAQPIPIGTFEQDRPYESNPTVVTGSALGSGAERDGSLATNWAMQGPAASASGTAFISGFTIPPPAQQFPIGWVDLKIKYKHPGLGDDGYHMGYKTSGLAYDWLQTLLSGPNAMFDDIGNPAVRTWVDLPTYPNTGAWTWTDIQNLMLRIIVTRGADATWSAFLDLYEIWVTVYEHAPPSSSTAMSVMPGASNISITSLESGKYFFTDVYLNGLSGTSGQLWGYQATIKYDESIVTALSYFTYYPFTVFAAGGINPGYVSLSYTMQAGDLVGFLGTATPLCRIYFQVDKGGATNLTLIDQRPTYITEITDPFGTATIPPLYSGWFSSPLYLSAQPPVLINLATPISTWWHEDYPTWSNSWHLSDWEDVSPLNPGELGPSDQIELTNDTGWRHWFHVENVTITIHWTLKEGEGGPLTEEIGVAEPEVPMLDMPLGSPIGTWWHMIYPTYCQWIQITSWVDSDGSGDFNPSDQFDYSLGAGDVLLAGTAPAAGSPLTSAAATGQQIMYVDADYSGTWDPGEPCFDDIDWDGMYISWMGDTHLVGPAIADYTAGSAPGVNDKFHDADYSYWWDPGEPAIRDVNANGIYDVATTYWAHLDAVSTDIIVCEKPIPPEPTEEPEFPLGIGLLLLVAPIVPLTYLWRLRKKVTKQ